MKFSESIGNISEALAKAQGEMKPAVFDATNPHYRSKYATLASIMESCREALSKNNLAVVQGTSVIEDRVVVTTMLVHSSGEFISDELSMNITKDSPHAVGSAITYARRYSLSSMVGIVFDQDDQDDDAESAEHGKRESGNIQLRKEPAEDKKEIKRKSPVASLPKPAAPPKTQINARIGKIRSIFNLSAKLGHTPDQMKKVIGELINMPNGIRESSDIPDDKLDVIVKAFSEKLEAMQNQAERKAA